MKTLRPALLAAAQLCCAGLVGGTALAANAPAVWSGLWRTPDQQGQALLDAGQPGQAAERFHDPRRRAYADLEAGRYPQAAQLLAPFGDAESEYNRGNALAQSGQLQAALAAYNAALAQTPTDKDTRHNRDLVERALRQQRQSAQSSRNGQQGGKGASSGQRQRSAAGQRGGSGSQQSGSASQQGGSRAAQAASPGRMASNGSQAGANQQGNSPTDPNSQASSQEGPGQAQRDAAFAAALARKQRQQGGPGYTPQGQGSAQNATPARGPSGAKAPDTGSLLAGGTQTPRQKPETEQQLALDQWLRQIPDSPAGLLQRKFLIEHMMKQQDGDEPPESAAPQPQGSGP